MADSYVCSGAKMKCSCGDKIATLTVSPDRTVWLTDQPQANISDHVPLKNIAPFGKCHTVAFPPTGAATAAANGKLTPMPCMPNTPFPWMNGKNDYIIKDNAALLKSSVCNCIYGGVITIYDDGQKIKVADSEERMLKRNIPQEKITELNLKNNKQPTCGSDVVKIKLMEDKTFIRVYDEKKSNKNGKNKEIWIMDKTEIEGLTPEEIKEKFALPATPTMVCDVKLDKGSILRKSIAGSNKMGKGGGIQYWGKQTQIKNLNITNERPLNKNGKNNP